MRRALVISCVLLLALVLSSFAEGIDFKSMSDEELRFVIDSAEAELDSRSSNISPWFDYGIGLLLPKPDDVFEREVHVSSFVNGDDYFNTLIDCYSRDEFALYVDAVRSFGFNSELDISSEAFSAKKNDEYYMYMVYSRIGDMLLIRVDSI